jgi:hypothetical protein
MIDMGYDWPGDTAAGSFFAGMGNSMGHASGENCAAHNQRFDYNSVLHCLTQFRAVVVYLADHVPAVSGTRSPTGPPGDLIRFSDRHLKDS